MGKCAALIRVYDPLSEGGTCVFPNAFESRLRRPGHGFDSSRFIGHTHFRSNSGPPNSPMVHTAYRVLSQATSFDQPTATSVSDETCESRNGVTGTSLRSISAVIRLLPLAAIWKHLA